MFIRAYLKAYLTYTVGS